MALHEDYRPQAWTEVFGQDSVINALQSAVEHNSSQTFMFSGPSGVGKTTLARITAYELGCDVPAGVMEIPAAVFTGVDEMRKIQEAVQFRPIGTESACRSVILDEAHRLSKQAWDSLLKATEEPPPYVYWFFCTTEPMKMPKTMHTRCMHLRLKELDKDNLTDLVDGIAKIEKIELLPEIRQLIVAKAEGSARQALVNLAVCRDIRDRAEAAELLQEAAVGDTVDLLKALSRDGTSWEEAMRLMTKLNGASAEGIRIQAVNWFAACAKKARSEREVIFFLRRLDAFAQSYENHEADAQLIRSIGQCLFTD